MMVDLQNIKNAINEGAYSEQGKAAMLAIVDSAIAKGTITPEEKQKLLNIIDLEIDQKDLEIKVNDKVAEMLEIYGAAIDAATQSASDDLDAVMQEESRATTSNVPQPMVEPEPVVSQTPTASEAPIQTETPPETPAQ